jgi:sucrose synthase
LLRYIESLFYLIYKPRAQQLLEEHMKRWLFGEEIDKR